MENFAGLEGKWQQYETSKIAILPVPYDQTSTWVKGSDGGPTALLEASVALEWLDLETHTEVYKQGIHTLPAIMESRSPELLCQAVETTITQLIKDHKFPVTIGGNHTVSIGAIRAMSKEYDQLTILQLDAHSDMRDCYEGSVLNHACVMYQASQVAATTQVGIRSMCIEELPHIQNSHIFYAHQIVGKDDWQQDTIDTLKENVYITIDLDVFDPSIMPSTGTPEPGGLLWYETLKLLRNVIKNKNVVGIDIVELCPNEKNRAPDFMAARLIYQLLTYQFHLRK